MSTRPLVDVEKETILCAIINEGGIRQAARKLKVSYMKIYRKLEIYGLSGSSSAAEIISEINRLRSDGYHS